MSGAGLLDALAHDQDPRRGNCQFCAWLRTRPEEEQNEWRVALKDKSGYTTASIIRQARKRGYAGGRTTPETHRKADHEW